jgi:hypothetical protein
VSVQEKRKIQLFVLHLDVLFALSPQQTAWATKIVLDCLPKLKIIAEETESNFL